jgi:predicted nuclease of predicted toxin-antitoxin system
MRFLSDQDVYAVTTRFLLGLGHDVATASGLGLAAAEDAVLLQRAQDDGRIFVTRDRDFGGLVFVERAGHGVLYLRITPATVQAVHDEVRIVLNR